LGHYRGGMRRAPSSRITSPLSISFSTMWTASAANSSGRPRRAHEGGPLSELGRQLFAPLLIEVGDDHVGALGVKASSGGFAEARGTARDERLSR
jgi:hypothetical protein